jgi:predicted MFS family arabinose efflux permease
VTVRRQSEVDSAGIETHGAGRPRVLTRALALVFLASFGALTCFYLLLSVVPLYATSVGAGGVGAGLVTAALMLSTVAAELVTPRLALRYGYRPVFAAGLLLLGAPALALPAAGGLAGILLVSVARGLGFGVLVVLGSALVAALVPAERRGEGLGLYGVVVGVPSIIALPLGVWLAGRVGFTAVFVAAAVASLAGLAAVPGIPGRPPDVERPLGILAGFRSPLLLRPCIVFAATTTAAGVVVTFLPLAVTAAAGTLAAVALLAQAATTTLTRWWAGRYGDRHGSSRLVMPSLLAVATGMLALALTDIPAAVLAGMVVFGAGFGVVQIATLSIMFERVTPAGYGTVSALWNLAFDAGLGLGAAGFGVLASQTGYPAAFATTAGLMLVALVPAWRDRAVPSVNQV